jgi:antitoxin component HigA of HigAB toxin-antitoxin module
MASSKRPKPGPSTGDIAKVDEVEQGLAAATPPPPELMEEIPEAAVDDAEALNPVRLRNLWIQLKQHDAAYLKGKAQAEQAEQQWRTKAESLETDRSQLKESVELCAIREADLAKAEAALEVMRTEAAAGFGGTHREIVAKAVQARDEALEGARTIEEAARERAQEIVASGIADTEQERERIAAEWATLQQQQTEVAAERDKLKAERELLAARESTREEQFDRQLNERVDAMNRDLLDARDLLELEQMRANRLRNEAAELRAQLALFPDDPQVAKDLMDSLNQQVRDLRDELSRRPPGEEIQSLRRQADMAAEALTRAEHWEQQFQMLDRQTRYFHLSVGELEVVRDERDALAAERETLRQALAQQRSDWEELQSAKEAQIPFPACSAYDLDPELLSATETREFDSLADLVDEARHRMATNASGSFYYSEPDVRLFLAGLAASRLHLLQGISGTGKTSLPREFFRAIGGDESFEIIEVQAGWRDRDDLFGYYNAFEKRFVETEFTKALYRALLPANEDRPMVVVLDEMNLAHPEQYFGSMLSILENAVTEEGYLPLLSSEVPRLPARFKGPRLPLPRNVWFVGTANHDETTVSFADKTHDRAHVQELPPRHTEFRARPQGLADPISYQALERAFEQSRLEHLDDARKVKAFLDGTLRDAFSTFGIGWGNRLDRQIDRFVPVVLDAGGTLTEAVDHLVATKLVRKLEDRFGVQADELDNFALTIEARWELDGHAPLRTLERLERESSRLRRG